MFVEVYKLGEEQEAVASLDQGAHVLGRGPALQCNDKRVSRKHATIEVTLNKVEITSNHINPCFLKVANSKTLTILPKDKSYQLQDGDTFAFLPDVFWFKIKIVNNAECTEQQSSKRPLDDLAEETAEKRKKMEENETKDTECNSSKEQTEVKLEETSNKNVNSTTMKGSTEANDTVQIKEEDEKTENAAVTTADNGVEADNTVKVEGESEDKKEDACEGSSAIKEEQTESKNDDGTGPSTSDTKPKAKREKCWYGPRCYRKSHTHREDYKHPGDSDFESDPDDARPSCSYGAACYRKNKDHRREYKHPPMPPQDKTRRTRKKVDRNYTDDLSDMSEEDPFAVDGESDEYVGDKTEDSDSDDTDWEDDNKECINNLVTEAMRFTRQP